MRYFVRVFDVKQRYDDYETKRGKIIEVFHTNNDRYVPKDGSSMFWKNSEECNKYREFLTEEVATSDLFQVVYGGISE